MTGTPKIEDQSTRSDADHPTAPVSHNQRIAATGEALAAAYLQELGYRVLDRNWRNGREGELDLVVCSDAEVVAVEVKTRTGISAGHPLEAITMRKARRLRQLLLSWVRAHDLTPQRLRIDAVGILLRSDREPRITHVEGIL